MRDVKRGACRKLIFDAQEASPNVAFERVICLLQTRKWFQVSSRIQPFIVARRCQMAN